MHAESEIRIPLILGNKSYRQISDDIIAPIEVGEYLQRTIPNSTLKVMNATGHCPHMSAPEETIEIIQDYLKNENLN